MEAIKTVGLVINIFKKPIIEIGLQVIQLLNARQVRTIAIGEEAEALGLTPTEKDDFCQMAQVVLVIGGDGTMLRAARTVYGSEIAILGINQGYLGFLTEIEI